MEREVVDLFEAAKKAAASAAVDGLSTNGPEVMRCVDALKQLKAFPITYDILVSTQVGKQLRPLTKHPKQKIKSVASGLLELWKKIVIDETARNKKNGSIDNNSSSKTDSGSTGAVKVDKVQKTSTVKVEKLSTNEAVKVERIGKDDSPRHRIVSKAETIKVEKNTANGNVVMDKKMDHEKTVKVEKIPKEENQASSGKAPPKLSSLIKCNDALRDKVRELLVEALSKVSSEADDYMRDEINACDPIRVAVSVESAMFEKLGRSNGSQKFKYRSIMFNIKDPNNPDLRRKVLLGHVKPERLISMTPDEMASDQRKRENDQIKEKALFECQLAGQPKATTDQFKCARCGQRKCTYYQMQTRSADEPMTTYVTCVNCNNHWKFC
ncbi:putative Transcript elongation factor IIS [Tripterygium wilfordii]|uniref:Transcription elongation factor n=1 Tax=Tripterygium wilfordii TaxID=458696 RepID=A0A7J7CT96_TRIWF|nr:transcription elongation factor TFIIS-like [Tripterygium wilfordii]KAF5737301.1 putative Transcript elongation factor IIS [Tripterygium wilfordii]